MKRLRLLIYESPTKEALDFQRRRDIKFHVWANDSMKISMRSVELNPFHITLVELIRLFWREAFHSELEED
jgi:hypothetical protein